jgi:beta-galactosidase
VGTRSGVVVAATILAWALATAPAQAHAPARSSDFDKGWRFALVNRTGITDPSGAFANAQVPSYDDASWRALDVPHDWSIELDPTDAPGSGTNSGTGFLQGGLGWYRKTFTLPRSLSGKQISVEFDGIYMDSSVYVNGQLATSHPYGYTGFAVDLTKLVHTDGRTPNVIAVKVQNQLPSSRWYSGSGIYRNVHLVVTDAVHVARHGVFVTTPDLEHTISSGYADVHVQTDVVDGGQDVAVLNEIRDARGRVVAAARGSDLRLRQPHLWSTETTPTSTRCARSCSPAIASSTASTRASARAGSPSIPTRASSSTAGT